MKEKVLPVHYSVADCDQSFSLETHFPSDFACFAIWEHARSRETDILADLAKHFEICGNFLFYWSDAHYHRNVERLYECPEENQKIRGYSAKIGKTPFRFVVVRDPKPRYTWRRSLSGLIEPSNETVIGRKFHYRSWFKKRNQVHSSNNPGEFLFQSALVLGPAMLARIIAGESNDQEVELHKDLEGAGGWKSWRELFDVLYYGSEYLVLRGFDKLPESYEGEEIDVLAADYQRFASAANVNQDLRRLYKGTLTVGGQTYAIDIRYVGDGYYPTAWARDLILNRQFKTNFYQPRLDDYFFSILYHAKVHKRGVKPTYSKLLEELAERMRFEWFDTSQVSNNVRAAEWLAGYMKANGYFFEEPVDQGVYKNKAVIRNLPHAHCSYRKPNRLLTLIKKSINEPERIPLAIKRRLVRAN